MKKLINVSFVLITVAAMVMGGCKGKQKNVTPDGEVDVTIPCSGTDYFTNNKVFRANSMGQSMDQITAKKIALTNARNDLAQSIQTTVKTVTDNYVNSTSVDKKEGLEQKFESLNREVVDQTLRGIRTICEKEVMVKKDGTYKSYIAIELSAEDLVSAYNTKLSADDKLKVDYDYTKFKETFDKEMDKMAKEKAGN